MPPLNQSVEEEVEENPPDPAPDQAGPSVPTETIAVGPPVLYKTKKRYPVVIQYGKGVSKQVEK